MILNIETIIDSNDKVKLEVKSLLNPWKETIVCYKRAVDHKLNVIRAYQMRTYLKGHLTARLKAYKSKGYAGSDKYNRIASLLHHMSTNYPAGGPQAFFAWVIRREETLRSSLSKSPNSSHDKMEKILALCKELS